MGSLKGIHKGFYKGGLGLLGGSGELVSRI